MKKILILLAFSLLADVTVAQDEASYHPETGDVFIPKLKVIGDNSGATYSVNMQKIAGDLNFNVNGVEPTRGCCRFVVPP